MHLLLKKVTAKFGIDFIISNCGSIADTTTY
jgi:hypothetical protein